MYDGAPVHKSKFVTKFLNDKNMKVLEWPENLPDLNPIENPREAIKKISMINKKNSKKIWVTLASLADCLPKRLQMAIISKGKITKY